jgi:hypothetical protein
MKMKWYEVVICILVAVVLMVVTRPELFFR